MELIALNKFIQRLRFIIELLYPNIDCCCFCGKYISVGQGVNSICNHCYDQWISIHNSAQPCKHCGFFTRGKPCWGPCQEGLGDLLFITSSSPYEDIYRQAIHELKYDGNKQLAKPLGFLMACALQHYLSQNKQNITNLRITNSQIILVPIPLHQDKEIQRGFNQSRLLADYVAYFLGLKVSDILLRKAAGKTQAKLSKQQRQLSLNKVFALKKDTFNIEKKFIFLIDDVVTTGATLQTCAHILQEKGCSNIAALTFSAGCNK